MLADSVTDKSVVATFPDLAYDWKLQVSDRVRWRSFGRDDFEGLKKKFGVSWVVLERPGVPAMPCPYVNRAVMVCRIP